jgi:hypothetical protein
MKESLNKIKYFIGTALFILMPVFVFSQIDDPNNFSVISKTLSSLSDVMGYSLQDNGKWASERNVIPFSDFKTTRNPSQKRRLGMDNFLDLEVKKVLINDKQYNVLIKTYRDGIFEFPMLKEDWKSYKSVKYWVFPSENLLDVFPKEVKMDEPYTVNLKIFCQGEILDYRPHKVDDQIVNKINRTLDATNNNAGNLVFAVWPLHDNDQEVVRFKLIETFNKRNITGYYLHKENIKKLFCIFLLSNPVL